MSIVFDLLVLTGYLATYILLYKSLKAQSVIEKKYNDLRVKYASLKASRKAGE